MQTFGIKCQLQLVNKSTENKKDPLPSKFKWNVNARDNYPLCLLSETVINKLTTFQVKRFSDDAYGVNEATETLTNIMTDTGKLCLKQQSLNRPKRKQHKWYDQDCSTKKQQFKQLKKALNRDPRNPYLRGKFCKERNEYKKLIRYKKQKEKDKIITELSM